MMFVLKLYGYTLTLTPVDNVKIVVLWKRVPQWYTYSHISFKLVSYTFGYDIGWFNYQVGFAYSVGNYFYFFLHLFGSEC